MCFGLLSRAWCPDQLDLALGASFILPLELWSLIAQYCCGDRGDAEARALVTLSSTCAQLRRVFIYVRQADGHLCPPERDHT